MSIIDEIAETISRDRLYVFNHCGGNATEWRAFANEGIIPIRVRQRAMEWRMQLENLEAMG